MKQFRTIGLWILLILCLSLSQLVMAGETGKIAGLIVDQETGDPIIGANVVLQETMLGAATDLEGEFFIINVPPGIYDVKVTAMGYQSEVRTMVRVKVDKTTRVDFNLPYEVLQGENVVVVAEHEDALEIDLTATKQNYSVDDIASLPGMNDVGDIINLQADVDGGHFRGGRSGEALYLVGGAAIVNPLNNSRAFEPMTIALEQVEVYTSGFSAEYGNVQSGVINMVAKEGSKDKWETHLDASTTNSYYKTWGGSVYSEDYNQYFDMLNSTEEWVYGTDPVSGVILWNHFKSMGFETNYIPETYTINSWPPVTVYPSLQDSMRAADMVRKVWLQSVREMGMEYDAPDYRVEFSTGGPIAEDATFFMAARQNVVQPMVPTGNPDVSRQMMSNITYRPTLDDRIKFIYNYNSSFDQNMTSTYYRWFERSLSVAKEEQSTHQIGVAWNHVMNPSTFFDIKVSQLFTRESDYVDLLGDSTYVDDYNNYINWRHYTAPTGYSVGRMQTTTGDEKTKTFVFNGSITSQINKRNLLKSGLQFFTYDIDVDRRLSRSNSSAQRNENYHATPYEGALYFQDKMEFEGLIANLGLRYDFYNLNTEYYDDKFSPYRNPNFDPTDPSQGGFYDDEQASVKETTLKTILQPRVGISFPVSEKSVLHMNYGVFTQRPPFEMIYVDRLKLEAFPDYERLGNPELEPEQTISYDVGLIRQLPFGFYLDVSAYLKDVSNLLQFAVYEDLGGNRYFTFDNREYADIKGFHVNLEKNRGLFRGYLRYNWEAAKGKSASAVGSGARSEYFENDLQDDILPSPDDIYLNYNRLHKLVCNLGMRSSKIAGPEVMGGHPLANISMSATYRLSSGRPFTYDLSGKGLQMNQRTPTEHNLSARVEKSVLIGANRVKFYLEGFNLLNKRFYDYSNVFEDPQNTQNILKERYMEDRENLETQTDFAPYTTSLEGFIYSNLPRHYRFGMSLDF